MKTGISHYTVFQNNTFRDIWPRRPQDSFGGFSKYPYNRVFPKNPMDGFMKNPCNPITVL